MKTLEEYLIKEGILELFLGNFVLSRHKHREYVNIDFAFKWKQTKEGFDFWADIDAKAPYLENIATKRVVELIKERIPRFRKGDEW